MNESLEELEKHIMVMHSLCTLYEEELAEIEQEHCYIECPGCSGCMECLGLSWSDFV
jgi:hypothetical protein